jgi:hypothetical protein
MVNQRIVSSLFVALSFLGCGKSDPQPNSGKGSQRLVQSELPPKGTYETTCSTNGTDNSEKSTIILEENGTGTFFSRSFVDAKCEGPLLSETRFDYLIRDIGGSFGEGNSIDLETTGISFTPHTDGLADYYNSEKICGLTTWSASTPIEVNGLKCGDSVMPNKGTVALSIFKWADGKLQFGFPEKTSGTPRPEKLDPEVYQLLTP